MRFMSFTVHIILLMAPPLVCLSIFSCLQVLFVLLPLCELKILANWTAYSQNTTRGFGFNPFETELMLKR